MKRRPWGIVIMSVMQLGAPVLSLLATALTWNTTPAAVLKNLLENGTWFQYLDFFLVPVIAAASIYAFRIWGYLLFVAICVWTIAQNAFNFLAYRDEGASLAWILVAQAVNLAIVSFFLFPGVRAAYFDRRMRWWETRPRYKVSVDGRISQSNGSGSDCEILDASIGGVFLRLLSDQVYSLGDLVTVDFVLEGYRIEAAAKVVHKGRILRNSYGFQYVERDQARLSAISRMVKTLDDKGYVSDRQLAPWQEDFKNWFKDVVHTAGRGMIPPAEPVHTLKRAPSSESASERKSA